MASSIPLSISFPSSSVFRSKSAPRSLRFCGLRREAIGFRPLTPAGSARIRTSSSRWFIRMAISAVDNGSAAAKGKFDYDIVIIAAGVGGHGAALHAVEKPAAREKAEKEDFEISISKTSFKANTKALAENEGEGLAKMIYRSDTGEILSVHILGLHVADL